VDGNLAYFSSAEMPLRKDLEQGTVDGLPPSFIRDGLGSNNWVPDPAHSQGQAIPFEILPYVEMPQTLNPENGFFVNANNDPAGTTLDNDALNQARTGKPSAIYYLNPGYAIGMRAGRITRLIENHPGKVSGEDMKRFQANVQQLDAELMTPFLLEAFGNASEQNAPSALAALADDPEIAEAAGRLATWDFSTPTGIPEGYDHHDTKGLRTPTVTPEERDASVAATIYNLWRGKAIRSVVDARLNDLGLGGNLPGSSEALKALHNLLSADPYTGVGASGVDFVPEPASLSADERRDLALLEALREALDALASNDFAPAFGNSTNQDDYRWGKLHRIVFDHTFENAFDIPPQSGFENLSPELRGLSRDGGFNVVNASGFSARADSLNSFMFGGGPVRRYVGEALTGPLRVRGDNVMPGGPSGIPGNPDYATQLGDWLTADYHDVNMSQIVPNATREVLTPP
jgi:penicillin amidase